MNNKCVALIITVFALIGSRQPIFAQTADFNEVGKRVAIMLQNRHFSHIPFDSKMSAEFLNQYLKDLDSEHIYFSQQDINGFNQKYGDNLHSLIFKGEAIKVAKDIYEVFRRRASEKIGAVKNILDHRLNFEKSSDIFYKKNIDTWPNGPEQDQKNWELYLGKLVIEEYLKIKDPNESGDSIKAVKTKVLGNQFQELTKLTETDDEQIANLFLSAIAKVYDPHSEYMTSKETTSFKDMMKNELVGIGAVLKTEDDGFIKVVGIIVDGPSDRANLLKLNDRIVAIDPMNSGQAKDMKNVRFMQLNGVIDLIRGIENTFVALKIQAADNHGKDDYRIIVIQRGKVSIKDEEARGDLIQVKIEHETSYRFGVITLPSFYSDFDSGKVRCSVDVERILLKLIDENIDGLIFDLRNNGGGVLEEVRRMTGFFVESGPVVQVKDALGRIQIKESDNTSPIYTGPMVVLTNKNSASASEIITGALQDYNRAVIVGDTRTFGKATVQQPMDIGRELPLFAAREKAGSLKITIQKFYRPSGSSTQIEGVHSDIVIPSLLDNLELGESFLSHALLHDRIKPADKFKPLDGQILFLETLKKRSAERVRSSKDFEYVLEDVLKLKSSQQAESISLNLARRIRELNEDEQAEEERNLERAIRFKEITKQDQERFVFSKLSLDSITQGAGFIVYDPSVDDQGYVRRSNDTVPNHDTEPKWPSGLDLTKREALFILKDLVDLTEQSKVADLVK